MEIEKVMTTLKEEKDSQESKENASQESQELKAKKNKSRESQEHQRKTLRLKSLESQWTTTSRERPELTRLNPERSNRSREPRSFLMIARRFIKPLFNKTSILRAQMPRQLIRMLPSSLDLVASITRITESRELEVEEVAEAAVEVIEAAVEVIEAAVEVIEEVRSKEAEEEVTPSKPSRRPPRTSQLYERLAVFKTIDSMKYWLVHLSPRKTLKSLFE